jgi:hypothetical protein
MTPFLLYTIGFEDVKSPQSVQVKVLVGLLALAKLLLGYSRQDVARWSPLPPGPLGQIAMHDRGDLLILTRKLDESCMSPSFFRLLSSAVLQANRDRRLIGRALVRFGGLTSPELQIESLLAILYGKLQRFLLGRKHSRHGELSSRNPDFDVPIFSPIYWLSLQRPSVHTTPVRSLNRPVWRTPRPSRIRTVGRPN